MKTIFKTLPLAVLLLSIFAAPAFSEDNAPNYKTLFEDRIEVTEGIALCPDGNIYFSNSKGEVHKIVDDETIELFSEGYIRPAGMGCDSENRLYITEYADGNIRKISADGKTSELFTGGLVEPNAMAAASDGTIYISQSKLGIVASVSQDGEVKTVADKIQYANGLLLNEDETMLYVNATTQMKTYLVMLKGENAGKKKTFAKGMQTPDGITTDGAGNIFVCLWAKGEIAKIDQEGNIEIIATGMKGPASPIYKDGNLYITSLSGKGIYKLPVEKK